MSNWGHPLTSTYMRIPHVRAHTPDCGAHTHKCMYSYTSIDQHDGSDQSWSELLQQKMAAYTTDVPCGWAISCTGNGTDARWVGVLLFLTRQYVIWNLGILISYATRVMPMGQSQVKPNSWFLGGKVGSSAPYLLPTAFSFHVIRAQKTLWCKYTWNSVFI